MKDDLFSEQINRTRDTTLGETWHVLARHKWWVIGCSLLAVAGAVVTVFSVRPVWEAKGTVLIGQLFESGQSGMQLVEPVSRAVERMQLKTFRDEVLSQLKESIEEENPSARLYRNSLKATAVPDAELISIRVKGYSPDQARSFLQATVESLRYKHGQIAAPTVERLNAQLKDVVSETETVRDQLENLYQANKLKPGEREYVAKSLLIANMVVVRGKQLRELNEAKLLLTEQLDRLSARGTSLIEPVHISDEPVAPKKTLAVILVGFVGFFIGILVAFLLEAFPGKE